MSRIKTYCWLTFHPDAQGHHQVHAIVAARSKVEVARIVGAKGPHALFNLGETGNDEQKAVAEASPGVVFWQGLNRADPRGWTRDTRYPEPPK